MRIAEGLVEFNVENISTGRGPGKKATGYYSEAMIISRDLTITVLKNYFNKRFRALDLLGGSGIRGIRIEKECGAEVTINDNNPMAIKIIKENVSLNGSNATVTRIDAKKCFPDGVFDYIDIDPYGTPVPFIDGALKSIKKEGIIGITATDIPNLTGTNFKKGEMLYHSHIIRNFYSHESGLRALISYFIKRAAEYEFFSRPILSYFGGYYYRIFFKMEKGTANLEKQLENIQIINYLSMKKYLGPIWIGQIHDKNFVNNLKVESYLQNHNRIENLKKIFSNENLLFFYSVEELAKRFKTNIPKIDNVIIGLNELGYRSSRTQFHPLGIKTTATLSILKNFFI